MNPQDVDERRHAARQLAPFLSRLIIRMTVLMCIQSAIVAALCLGVYFKKTEAYGITQSGDVFTLKERKK